MDTPAAASAGTGVCIEIIEGSEIKTEPLEAILEHHSACPSHLDDGVLIEPPQQHIFLRPFPPITSQPVVITETKSNRVSSSTAVATVAAAASAAATATASSAGGTSSASVILAKVRDSTIFIAASVTRNPSTSTQVPEAEIAASFDREQVSTSGSPSIDQMQQQQPNTSTAGRAGNAAFFRRKKAIPFAVAKKMGTSKPPKAVPSEVTPPIEKNVNTRIEENPSESRLSPDQITEVQQTVQVSTTTASASISTEETVQQSNNEQEMPQPNTKPGAFRRVKPKVTILPTAKPPKTTLKISTESKNESSSSDTLVTSVERELNDPQGGKNEEKELIVSPGDGSETKKIDPSKQTVAALEDKTIVVEENNANEDNASLKNTQSTVACLDQPVKENVQSSASEKNEPLLGEKLHHQRSTFPDLHNDKENLLVATSAPPEMPKSMSKEENSSSGLSGTKNRPMDECKKVINESASSQPVATSPVGPGKTIKRTIKLGNLPLDLAKQLKSAIGIGKRPNAKVTASISGEKKSQQPVQQRSDDVKVASVDSNAAADTKLREIDLRHDLSQHNTSQQLPEADSGANQSNRPSAEPTESMKVPVSSSVEESFSSSAKTSVTTCPLNDHSSRVASGTLEGAHSKSLQTDGDDASEPMKPLPSSGEDSMQMGKGNGSKHVSPVTPAEAVDPPQQPTAGNKKIKKISYLTPLQQKMLLSSLIKAKPKSSEPTDTLPTSMTGGGDTEMAVSTGKQKPETARSIATSAPKPPTVGFTSPERKIQIISHVILPNLKLATPCNTSVTGGPSQFPSAEGQSAPNVHVHPPSFSSSAFTSTELPPAGVVYDQYPKLFVIHSTAPVPSDVVSVPSTSSTISHDPDETGETGEALETGDVLKCSPQATPEKRPEPPGLVLTVLPRPTLPEVTAGVPGPSQASSQAPKNTSSATYPADHRIVPKIVIDKSYVENDSQSSSSCSSFSSPEQATNVTSISKRKSKTKLYRGQRRIERRVVDTASTATDTQPKIMGCSPKTRDKLRQRVLKNLESHKKPPVLLFPTNRRVYFRKPQSSPVPSENVEMGLISLTSSDERESKTHTLDSREVTNAHFGSVHSRTNLLSSAQPVDLRMQPLMPCPLEEQRKFVKFEAGEGTKGEEPLHAEQQQQRQDCSDFYGFSNSSIDSEQFECGKKIRAIEAMLQAINMEEVNPDENVQQEYASDRSSPVVGGCLVSDTIDAPDERDGHKEESIDLTIGDRQTESTSSKLEPCFLPPNAMPSSASSFEDHRKVVAPLGSPCETCTVSVAQQGPPDVPVEVIVSSEEHRYVNTSTSFGDAGDAVELDASETDVIDLTLGDSTIVEQIADRSAQVHVKRTSVAHSSGAVEEHGEKDSLQQLDKCSVAAAGRVVAEGKLEEDKFMGTNNLDAEAGTSTIAPFRTTVNARSSPVSEAHETTGVDLIVAMAMSMKENEVEDDELSEVDSDSDFGATNRFDEMDRGVDMDMSCIGTVRNQSVVSLSRTNKRKRRKKRDKIVELLLRHVNYGSLMGELTAKAERKTDTTERNLSSSEESDDEESESITHLLRRIQARNQEKDTPTEVEQPTCAQKLSTDEEENDKVVEADEEESDSAYVEQESKSGVLSANLKPQQTQPEEADKRIVDIGKVCAEIKSQEVKEAVCLQSEDDGNGLESNLFESSLVESAEKTEDSLERQAQNRSIDQTREMSQVMREQTNDLCEDSCNSIASLCYDYSTVNEHLDDDDDDGRRDDDELLAQNIVTCDITENEEIIRSQYSPEAIQSIRSSLVDDHAACTRRMSVAAAETPVEASHVTTTICDISNNDIVESTTVSSTRLDGVGDCVATKSGAAEEATDMESSHKTIPEPVTVDIMEASANFIEDTATVNAVALGSSNKRGAKKGRKRSNKSSPAVRPTKRKKPLNLLDIKPPSPPVFDSSEAPVANEVVSDCSTDGFSAADRTSRQERVGMEQKTLATSASMDRVDTQSGSKVLDSPQKSYVALPKNSWGKNKAAIKETPDGCSSKLATDDVDIRSPKANRTVSVGRPVGGCGGDRNVQSSGEDDGKGNRSHIEPQTKRGAQKPSRSKLQEANKECISARRGNASRSRHRKGGRSRSSSSSRRSSSGGSNKEAADVSSDDSFRPRVTRAAKRRKLKRKKRSTPRGRSSDNVSDAPTTTTVTTTTTSRATNSSIRRSARCKLSKASTISKASNTDERYVISEIDTADEAPQRVMEVVNVRYQQVLDMAGTNTRPSIINTVPLARLTAPMAQASANDCAREGHPSGIGSGQSEPESQSVAAEEDTSDGTDVSKQPKRGRPPKPLVESDASVDDSVTEYKCGNCGKEMHRSTWKEHHASHNGLAFRVGIDEPIDLNDIKAVGYAIMRFMRTNRRFEVICEKCGQVKKSFMGMASHLKTCGIPKEEKDSAKVACEHCGRKMLIVSIPSHHTLYCRVLREQREKEAAERGESETVGPYGAGASEDADEQLTARGRQKRRSVACAERKIRKIARETIEEPKELIIKVTGQTVTMGILQVWLMELKETGQATCRHKDCFFVGTSEKTMRTHNDICPYGQTAVPVYECAICLCQDPSRDVVYEHLCQQHPEEQLRWQQQSAQSGDECDANVATSDMVEGSSGSDDMEFDGDVLDEDDLVADGRKAGRKKKQAPARSKTKKGPPKAKKATASKKGAPPEDDLQMGVMGEEGEVYKEMVYEEAAEYRHQRANIQFTTIQWTFKFMREQYCTRQLFEQLRPDVDVRFLTMLAIRDYLPQSGQSMRFRQRKIKLYDAPFQPDATPDGWQRLGTFQGESMGSESMFYCGGPVMALDWLPIPSESEDGPVDQILAVACKSRYGEFYTCQQLSKPQSGKCLIQIWNVGPLRNGSSTTEEPATQKSTGRCKKAHSDYENEIRCPQLSFAIACDFGPIWQLAFCPSGCNNETGRGDSFDRLGLLAATGSDGDVYVFALNRSMVSVRSELPASKPTPRIVHLQPVLRLSLTLHQRRPSSSEPNAIPCFTGHSVMRIAWTREKGHTVLAAGYSNGIVAVWKLTSASFSSSLLSASKDGIRTLLPTHKLLHASGSSITALDIHFGQGSRFLAVTNADRRVKVYDLHSGHHQPLEVLSLQARSRITAMRWLLHFPVLVFVFDDTFLVDRCGYTVHQPREIGIRMLPLLMLGTEATDIAANEWISTNAITTDGGDLVCHKPIPFVAGIPGKQFGQVLTTTTSVRLNSANASPTIVSSYDAFYENYGLLFSDTDENPAECDRKSLRVKAFRRGNIEQYPAVRLNQIRWNPNSSSFLHYAVGYQAGFVRIRKMQL